MRVQSKWREYGLLNEGVVKNLTLLTDLILEWNPRINLTGFRDRESVENILIGESALALHVVRMEGKEVLDFGSGAGIPGLVWAICNPSIRLTSLEVRQKKIAFQKEAIRSLRLDVRIISGRFPEAVRGEEFDWIVSRAIRFDPVLWKIAENMVRSQGGLIRFASARDCAPKNWNAVRISQRTNLLFRFKRSGSE